MSFDECSDDEDKSTSSKSSSSSNHVMILRSSCSSACTVGGHCIEGKRNRIKCQGSNSHDSVSLDSQYSTQKNLIQQSFISGNSHKEWSKSVSTTTSRTKVHIRHEKSLSNKQLNTSSVAESQNTRHAIVEDCTKSSHHKASKDMARTIYKKNALTRVLGNSDLMEIESVGISDNSIGHHNGSKMDQSMLQSKHLNLSLRQCLYESRTLSTKANSGEIENEDMSLNTWGKKSLQRKSRMADYDHQDYDTTYLAENPSPAVETQCYSQSSVFWSFFSWRKYLYFALSKPTHYDVELLERIRTFGKYKTTVFLLLPLIFLLLSGLIWKNGVFLQEDAAVTMGHSIQFDKSVHKLDSLIKVTSSQLENNSTTSNLQISRNEVKILIKEILREEFLPQIIKEKTKGEKIADTKREIEDIWKEVNSFNAKIDSFSESLVSMQEGSQAASEMSSNQEMLNTEQNSFFHEINEKVVILQKQFIILDQMLSFAKNCCRNDLTSEAQMAAAFALLLETHTENPKLQPFRDWLSSEYISSKQLQEQVESVKSLFMSRENNMKESIEAFIKEHLESIRFNLSSELTNGTDSAEFSSDFVHKIVKEAIMLYDADKLGKTDYALESGGGAVINTRCSESYNEGQPTLNIFGFRLWNLGSSPRNAIQPDMHPGQCWAFKGSHGYLVIELSSIVRPTSFIIEHIPKSLSPTGNIDSAPKDFVVLGLTSEKDGNGKVLGKFTYDKNGSPLQEFPVQVDDSGYYPIIELQIRSNHGHLKYTCLYRFRVHGTRLQK